MLQQNQTYSIIGEIGIPWNLDSLQDVKNTQI